MVYKTNLTFNERYQNSGNSKKPIKTPYFCNKDGRRIRIKVKIGSSKFDIHTNFFVTIYYASQDCIIHMKLPRQI